MDTRQRLLEAAISEFAANGFEGASTRRIAESAGSHQPQINYFFGSKQELWRDAVGLLFGELGVATDQIDVSGSPADVLCDVVGEFVRFAHRRPALHRIMFHEFSSNSERLQWVLEHHTGANFGQFQRIWMAARAAGATADIDARVAFHTFVGAASLLPVARAELAMQLKANDQEDIDDDDLVAAHVRAVQLLLLPGLEIRP